MTAGMSLVSAADTQVVTLRYGREGQFSCALDAQRIVAARPAPEGGTDVCDELRTSLERPLQFPPMEQAVIPDDYVVLAVDRHTPRQAEIVAEIWRVLEKRGIHPRNVRVVQPPGSNGHPPSDPRSALPENVRREVGWIIHDPEDEAACAYLASTAGGERIYLSRELTDADFVVSIGPMAFDPVLGYRGTSSVFYPGLSSSEAVTRMRGQGHSELGPEDERPLRQMVDEVGWLLGSLFTVQAIPAVRGGVARILAGATEAVYRQGRELVSDHWLVELPSRPDVVVAAVDADAGGHGWEQIAAAAAAARQIVARDGHIVILSELQEEPGAGIRLISRSESPRDALQPLRKEAPPDLVAATQLADAADWARVYLLSRLESDLLEELFVMPLESEREVERLLERGETVAFLEGAQHVYGRVTDPSIAGD